MNSYCIAISSSAFQTIAVSHQDSSFSTSAPVLDAFDVNDILDFPVIGSSDPGKYAPGYPIRLPFQRRFNRNRKVSRKKSVTCSNNVYILLYMVA